jgi:conjugal transfer pilus assembly protein TraF
MDDPTPENVERYMLLQRYAVDKADRFSSTWMQVVRNTPYLDESINRPLSTAGKNTTQEQILEFRKSLLKLLAGRGIGIWYFYRSDCPYCVRQDASLAIVERVHGLPVLPIAMDGQPPPTDAFARYVLDSGQAQALGVRGTPTLYLNNTQDGSVERLTVGLRAADEIEDALIHAARRANWISEDEFVRATQGRAFPLLVDGEPPPADLSEDPDMLLAYLRATAAPDQFTPIDPSRSPGAAR